MEDLLRLSGLIEECKKHLKRLELASHKMGHFMPLSGESFVVLSEDEIEHMDQYLYRFAKLQDTLGDKVFKALLIALGENIEGKAFIDIFNRLDALGIIEHYDQWILLRKIRNEVSHEYDATSDEIAQKLNKIYDLRVLLANYANLIFGFVESKINNIGIAH